MRIIRKLDSLEMGLKAINEWVKTNEKLPNDGQNCWKAHGGIIFGQYVSFWTALPELPIIELSEKGANNEN